MYKWYIRFTYLATVLALCVIVLGAWVRLTDAGLEIETPANRPNEHAYVWKVELE